MQRCTHVCPFAWNPTHVHTNHNAALWGSKPPGAEKYPRPRTRVQRTDTIVLEPCYVCETTFVYTANTFVATSFSCSSSFFSFNSFCLIRSSILRALWTTNYPSGMRENTEQEKVYKTKKYYVDITLFLLDGFFSTNIFSMIFRHDGRLKGELKWNGTFEISGGKSHIARGCRYSTASKRVNVIILLPTIGLQTPSVGFSPKGICHGGEGLYACEIFLVSFSFSCLFLFPHSSILLETLRRQITSAHPSPDRQRPSSRAQDVSDGQVWHPRNCSSLR